ncbi:hypothetical protein C5470_02510 [Photorhabdus stackebrandtii]|uniref:Uncharacterized protein n=1 Tax=Photorhabdus stackebrandtii TaxID=1123042 RepID=A0A7X5QJC8_9GAMM|nr:hypothetical protein [Photorhabdus stackebrandtii]
MSFIRINKVILFFWSMLINITKNAIDAIESTVAENSNESHYRNGNIYFISAQVKNYQHFLLCKRV